MGVGLEPRGEVLPAPSRARLSPRWVPERRAGRGPAVLPLGYWLGTVQWRASGQVASPLGRALGTHCIDHEEEPGRAGQWVGSASGAGSSPGEALGPAAPAPVSGLGWRGGSWGAAGPACWCPPCPAWTPTGQVRWADSTRGNPGKRGRRLLTSTAVRPVASFKSVFLYFYFILFSSFSVVAYT